MGAETSGLTSVSMDINYCLSNRSIWTNTWLDSFQRTSAYVALKVAWSCEWLRVCEWFWWNWLQRKCAKKCTGFPNLACPSLPVIMFGQRVSETTSALVTDGKPCVWETTCVCNNILWLNKNDGLNFIMFIRHVAYN